jgi:hypothetical protein
LLHLHHPFLCTAMLGHISPKQAVSWFRFNCRKFQVPEFQ